ncbi:phosphatase PAP2 family protein [Compostimonas suwonensis]|uniref:Undecaprenyl-diphosphatase n=1 Tax=Compostimonas suwonensis TaxID=1048394 RepID=A0A2M9BCI2_9MICO|nr:phosphatase PAP2 family protein [Compostimonas suwonensis]PJJ55656.1 undecaprenyl-diphosphatase [Compostimonas suwonensis]
METTTPASDPAGGIPVERRLHRRWPVLGAVTAVIVVVLMGLVIVVRERGLPFSIDEEWLEELLELRDPFWDGAALVMDFLGGGLMGVFVVPGLIVVTLLIYRRPWGAGYYAAATVLSAALVQIIKNVVGRPRPEDMLVTSDFGSFPSGHVANAATMAVALGILFPRVWVWVAGVLYTVLMLLSRTYLGAHWLTDTIGGIVLGAGVAVLVWAPFAARLHRERRLPHRPFWMPQTGSRGPDGPAGSA